MEIDLNITNYKVPNKKLPAKYVKLSQGISNFINQDTNLAHKHHSKRIYETNDNLFEENPFNQPNPLVKIYINEDTNEYFSQMSFPRDLDSIKVCHANYGEVNLTGTFSIGSLNPDQLFYFSEETIITNPEFVKLYSQNYHDNEYLMNRNQFIISLNVSNTMRDKLITGDFQDKLKKSLLHNNFVLLEINKDFLIVQTFGKCFDKFSFREVLDSLKSQVNKIPQNLNLSNNSFKSMKINSYDKSRQDSRINESLNTKSK